MSPKSILPAATSPTTTAIVSLSFQLCRVVVPKEKIKIQKRRKMRLQQQQQQLSITGRRASVAYNHTIRIVIIDGVGDDDEILYLTSPITARATRSSNPPVYYRTMY